MPKMPKIVESLRSVFIMNDRCLAYGKPEIREIIPDLAFLFIKIDRSTQSFDSEALEGRLSTGRIPQPVESLLAERL
jgi:hypothetical protein